MLWDLIPRLKLFYFFLVLLYENSSKPLISIKQQTILIMTQKNDITAKEAIATGIAMGRSGHGMSMLGNKKGNFGMMTDTAKGLVVFGIMIGVGLLILGEFQSTTVNTSLVYTEIGNVMALFSDLTVWGGIVLIVIMAYIIMRYLGVFSNA